MAIYFSLILILRLSRPALLTISGQSSHLIEPLDGQFSSDAEMLMSPSKKSEPSMILGFGAWNLLDPSFGANILILAVIMSLVAIFLILSGSALAFNCSIKPIYIDAHYREVHGTEIFEYGNFIGVGTPSQNQSSWASLSRNETSVADINFCQHSNLTDCAISTNGFYEMNRSSSWTKDKTYRSQDLQSPFASSDIVHGFDGLDLFTHFFQTSPAKSTRITDMPIEVILGGSAEPGIVGLGPNSTLLTRIFDMGLSASHAYSFYVGTGFKRATGDINGSITFGGFDSGRFIEPVHNFTLNHSLASGLGVTVSDIILDDPSGSIHNLSLLGDLSDGMGEMSFDAEITTDQYPMSLPYEVTQAFINALGAVPSDNIDGSLRVTKPFNGTMNITLSHGFRNMTRPLTISLPSQVVSNISGISPIAQRQKDDKSSFVLGASYLSEVYLMVNYDDDTFHLAQVDQEAPYIIPKTWCPHTVPKAYVLPNHTFATRGLIGAVLGGVIGGTALLTLIAMIFITRRRVKQYRARTNSINKGKSKFKGVSFDMIEDGESLVDSPQSPSKRGWMYTLGRSQR
ncbi:MAG: hypothetical protein M1834_005169 [Cirrosporium novae-zelandiae]|nr:MAG: hypothetical protein M1834_005169 [Cirrosporium novae-zelandiae]